MTKSEREAWAAVCATLERVGGKELHREALVQGQKYPVELSIRGTVGRVAISRRLTADTAVGHDTEVAVAHGPEGHLLTAHLLSLIPKTKRAAVIEQLPEVFAAAGVLPEASAELVEQAKKLHERLRTKILQQRKGTISAAYRLEETVAH